MKSRYDETRKMYNEITGRGKKQEEEKDVQGKDVTLKSISR